MVNAVKTNILKGKEKLEIRNAYIETSEVHQKQNTKMFDSRKIKTNHKCKRKLAEKK